jgi:hypothetical protein
MVLFEPVHGGAALRWCGRFRAGTCATATVFTITNLVPGGGPINLLTEQLAGMPLLSAAGLVTFLASGVLLSLYFGSLVLSQKLAQHRLRRLWSDTGAIPRTFLYLRSFDHGKSSLIDRIRRIFEHGTVGPFARAVYKMHDPEEEIAHAVASAGLLVAIGDKTRSYGAAKLRTDDAVWQDEVLRLAEEAELIFISPALTEGSKWELHQLIERKELLRKSIFVMPRNWYADEWDELRQACRELFSLEFPEYEARGAYFAVGEQGHLHRTMEPEAFIRSLNLRPTREAMARGLGVLTGA